MGTYSSHFYRQVIASQRWKWMKDKVIRVRGNRCEGCGETGCRLELHHDTYERLGRELPQDVRLLCQDCHRAEDIFRAERGRRKSEDAYHWACIDGWMSRRHGEDWDVYYDPSEAAEMYSDWQMRSHW
jgi:hypothetical protein